MSKAIYPHVQIGHWPIWTQGYFESLIDPSASDILKDEVTDFNTINDIDINKLIEWLKEHGGGHHALGTCKMGTEDDSLAVVDEQGLVYGMKKSENLWCKYYSNLYKMAQWYFICNSWKNNPLWIVTYFFI